MNSALHLGLVMQGGSGWTGGAEYVKNLLYATTSAAKANGHSICATLLAGQPLEPEWETQFAPLSTIRIVGKTHRLINRWLHLGNRKLQRLLNDEAIDFLFPLTYENEWTLGLHFPIAPYLSKVRWAGWIPDFQHRHLPQLFSEEDRRLRDEGITHLASEAETIVFSSEAAAADYRTFWPNAAARPFVLRFCTVPNADWFEGDPFAVQKSHQLPDRFFLVSNQFWQHKNHKLVFEAVGILAQRGLRVHVVCTGNLHDYRSKTYLEGLRQQLADLGVANQVSLLGLVPRRDQIQLMRRCLAVIQPSLSEGWSTVVEDARLLGKPVVLSDLPVHHEQNPPGAQYFTRDSSEELASQMERFWKTADPGPDLLAEQGARTKAVNALQAFGERFWHLANGGL